MSLKTHVTHQRVDIAHQYLNRANDTLQDALRSSSAVEGIILLDFISRLANVRSDISGLCEAIKQDAIHHHPPAKGVNRTPAPES